MLLVILRKKKSELMYTHKKLLLHNYVFIKLRGICNVVIMNAH